MSYIQKLGVTKTNKEEILRDLEAKRSKISSQIEAAESADLDCMRLYNSYKEISRCIEEIKAA